MDVHSSTIPPRHTLLRDLLTSGLFILLLLPVASMWLGQFLPATRSPQDWMRVLELLPSVLASPLLPAALGMMLALRVGVLDVSIWATMGLGSLIAVRTLHMGHGPGLALAATLAAGLAVGTVNALLALPLGRFRRLATLGTIGVGLLILWALPHVFPAGGLQTPPQAYDAWAAWMDDHLGNGLVSSENGNSEPPGSTGLLLLLRMVLAAAAWAGVLLVLVLRDSRLRHHDVPPRPKAGTACAALIASGMLAAWSGYLWQLETGDAPLPHRLVDDLLIPAGVLACGSMVLRGRGRTMLCGILLPGGLLLARAWQQVVCPVFYQGYDVQLLLLIVLFVMIQGGLRLSQSSSRKVTQAIGFTSILLGIGVLIGAVLLTFFPDTFDARGFLQGMLPE